MCARHSHHICFLFLNFLMFFVYFYFFIWVCSCFFGASHPKARDVVWHLEPRVCGVEDHKDASCLLELRFVASSLFTITQSLSVLDAHVAARHTYLRFAPHDLL